MLGILRVGFTGTQLGMSRDQSEVVRWLLWRARSDGDWLECHFHHGDCIGADAEAHAMATELKYRPIIHPPVSDAKRAWCQAAPEDVRRQLPYLERNRSIVDCCSVLIAAPGSKVEYVRSGTWSTVRYAFKMRRKTTIVFPDGTRIG